MAFHCMAATSQLISGERIPLVLIPEAKTPLELTRMEPAPAQPHWPLSNLLRHRYAAGNLPHSANCSRAAPTAISASGMANLQGIISAHPEWCYLVPTSHVHWAVLGENMCKCPYQDEPH